MLQTKVGVNACLDDESTGIYLASGFGHSGIVSTFLQFGGADPNLKTSDS